MINNRHFHLSGTKRGKGYRVDAGAKKAAGRSGRVEAPSDGREIGEGGRGGEWKAKWRSVSERTEGTLCAALSRMFN